MKSITLATLMFLMAAMIFSGCGPSAEEVAAMTQAAASPTPLPPTVTPIPTPTATPIPIDLSILVVNQAGEPIPDAILTLMLADYADAEQISDATGTAVWPNLPSDMVNYMVSAGGYFETKDKAELVNGPNNVTITLEADPYGVLPENACAPGETLIMVEDMQDQKMQGWTDLIARLESGAPGVEIIEDVDQPGNWILKAYNTTDPGHIQIGNYDEILDDAVVRFRTRNNGAQHLHVGWHHTNTGRYIAFIYADGVGGRVDKFEDPVDFTAFSFGGFIGDGNWHTIEISTFNDVYEIWIDGVKGGSWQDLKPLAPGTFFLDADFWQSERIVEFDDISVCQLSAPFTSILVE